MHRTEGDGYAVVGGKHQFTAGDPLIPVPATQMTADWANAVQEELAGVVEGLGGTLNTAATDGTPNQVLTRLLAVFGQLISPNTRANNTAFQVAPLNNDSSEASPFISSTTAPASGKRWCLLSMAVGGGVYARLYVSSTGSFSFTTNASWSNSSSAWTADVSGTASYRLHLGSTGLVVYSYTSAGGTFTDATFTATSLTLGAGTIAAAGTANGATLTNSTTNGSGATITGNGTGAGVAVTGGASSATGGVFTGGAPNGYGISTFGAGTGAGGRFSAGTAANATTPRNAVELANGYLSLDGVTAPNSNVAVKNTLTPANICKAWASLTSNATASPTLNDAFGITSVSASSSGILITFAQAFSSTNYVCTTGGATGGVWEATTKTTTTVLMKYYNISTNALLDPSTTTGLVLDIVCMGRQ